MERTEANVETALSPNDIVTGVVEQIMPYGAFVRLSTGQKAMVHISQLSHRYIKNVEDCLQVQQEIRAKVIKIDERGRVDLSIKVLEEPPAPSAPRFQRSGPPSRNSDSSNPDDFEKKLSSFLKTSEERISDMMSKGAKSGRPARRRGARP